MPLPGFSSVAWAPRGKEVYGMTHLVFFVHQPLYNGGIDATCASALTRESHT